MIVLGLGSSRPDALSWLRRAVRALKAEPGIRILRTSPVYESDALLPPEAPSSWNVPYLNLAVACVPREAGLNPPDLLERLKRLEKKLGRRTRERWAPREIDIDILTWGELRLQTDALTLPHPGLLDRPFALLPLEDVAPEAAAREPGARERLARWTNGDEAVPFHTRKTLHRLTELVAILNLTPDSFSDGGRLSDPSAIVETAREAVSHGALILDLGAESTRPGAAPVEPAEEWRRLGPALQCLEPLKAATPGLALSVDTRHPETMERALETGSVDWLNDVSGFGSERARAVARGCRAELVAMHSLGAPPRRELRLAGGAGAEDPIQSILRWGEGKLAELDREGISPERVILDPGIGFGKSPSLNLRLLREAWRFHAWGVRVLIGHSRKSFLSAVTAGQCAATELDLESALLSARLADQGVELLRVHSPSSHARALRLSAAWDGGACFFKSASTSLKQRQSS